MNTTIRIAALGLALIGVGARAQTTGPSTPSTTSPTTPSPTTAPTNPYNESPATTTTPAIPQQNVANPTVSGTGGGGMSNYDVATGAQPTTGYDAGFTTETNQQPGTVGSTQPSTTTTESNQLGSTGTYGSDAGVVTGTGTPQYGQYGYAADAGEPRQAGATNTRRNQRDRDQGALTAQDQGNSPTDRKITASVRRELMDARLSFDAKNIKIITNGSRVTLRGPVSSEDEKARIQSLAEKVSGVTAVDNQLEVKK